MKYSDMETEKEAIRLTLRFGLWLEAFYMDKNDVLYMDICVRTCYNEIKCGRRA